MSGNKTVPNPDASVTDFLNSVEDPNQSEECFTLLEMTKKITGEPAVIWGPGIVGFGSYLYTYPSGREGIMLRTGFSPRARQPTLYVTSGFDRDEGLMGRLGKYKAGKSCLYIKRLSDVNLEELIAGSYTFSKNKNQN